MTPPTASVQYEEVPATSGRDEWVARVGLIALVLLTFGRLIGFGSVDWDDHETIFQNPLFRPVTVNAFIEAWARPQMMIYIPITQTIWATLASLFSSETAEGFRISPVPFRVLSILLHAGSTLITFSIIRRMGSGLWMAALAAAVFAVHPIQVETVAWISGQKDLLAGFFVLAAVWAALRGGTDESPAWIIATWVLAVAAMLSKPQAVTAPIILLAVLWATGVRGRRLMVTVMPLLIPAAILALVGRAAQPAPMVDAVAWWARPLIALDAVGWYATTIALPFGLAVDQARRPSAVLTGNLLGTAVFGLALVGFVIALVWRNDRRAFAGMAFAMLAVLPVLGFVPFLFQYHSTVTNHYAYTAMAGVAILLASLGQLVPVAVARRTGAAWVALLAIGSFVQVDVWQSTDRLFEHNYATVPESMSAKQVLAFQSSRRGDDATAILLLREALRTHPRDPSALYNLANALVRVGDITAAHEIFEEAIEAGPDHLNARHNYAMLLIREQDWAAAQKQLEAAIAIHPNATASIRALERLRAIRANPSANSPATTRAISP